MWADDGDENATFAAVRGPSGSPVLWCGAIGDRYGNSTSGQNPADRRRHCHNQNHPFLD
jgi:hypothetical protein